MNDTYHGDMKDKDENKTSTITRVYCLLFTVFLLHINAIVCKRSPRGFMMRDSFFGNIQLYKLASTRQAALTER